MVLLKTATVESDKICSDLVAGSCFGHDASGVLLQCAVEGRMLAGSRVLMA